ncbi:MAG: 4-phosphoerythronate dehydrogenase [Bacteroidales bacterium]
MLHIVADAAIPFLEEALAETVRLTYIPGNEISRHHLMKADALIVRTRTRCNEQLLEGTPVQVIASATIGSDHIDAAYCASRGIKWSAAPGCNAGAVRQYLASALACIIKEEKTGFQELTLGVIGAGNIGSIVARMAEALGMRTLINDPPREANEGPSGFSGLGDLLAGADIISLHVPLTHDGPYSTHHLAGQSFFEKTKPGAWFINTSRGEVADTQAILNALERNIISGAVIDVWEKEPHISPELVNASSLATPHVAGYSVEGKANGSAMSVQTISRHFGLGLDQWHPRRLIPPKAPFIFLEDKPISKESLVARINLHAYNIHGDSAILKQAVKQFEKIRENYVFRREPGAFKVTLGPATIHHRQMIRQLGYGIAIR